MFQQNIVVAMALALVWEARNMFPDITKGRKEINPTELNTTGNELAAGWLGLHPTKIMVEISLSELAAGTQRVSLTWSPEPFFPHIILVFMNENSWLPYGYHHA